jgi:putative transposase
VMLYIRCPLSLRQVEYILFERRIDICHETNRLWWNSFGPMFAASIRRKRVESLRAVPRWPSRIDHVAILVHT